MSQRAGASTAGRVVGLGMRPLRVFAPVFAVGAVVFIAAAVWLLVQSGGGVVTFAEGRPDTAITIPVAATDPLVIYGTTRSGQTTPDTTCRLTSTTNAFVALDLGQAITAAGRVLHPLGKVTSGWRTGDTITCSGNGIESVVLGHDSGRIHGSQGLLSGFVGFGAAVMALVGFASRRRPA